MILFEFCDIRNKIIKICFTVASGTNSPGQYSFYLF